jgi:hypothetical protein
MCSVKKQIKENLKVDEVELLSDYVKTLGRRKEA